MLVQKIKYTSTTHCKILTSMRSQKTLTTTSFKVARKLNQQNLASVWYSQQMHFGVSVPHAKELKPTTVITIPKQKQGNECSKLQSLGNK